MHIRIDDLQGAAIQALLQEHLPAIHSDSPTESVHALDVAKLRHPSVTVWTAWDGRELLGCGAIKQLDGEHAELKSMRTAQCHQRKGVARTLLRHIEAHARAHGIRRISLETDTPTPFEPARRLYASEGFRPSRPFGYYSEDPYSVFMTKEL